MIVHRQTQQSVAIALGARRALQACAPTCFYMVGQAAGYIPADVGLVAFCERLDWRAAFVTERGWIRPALAQQLRAQYGMAIVSWQLGGNRAADPDTLARMTAAGYVTTEREVQVYREEIVGRDVVQVVQAGYPVIAGMKPGFGSNSEAHAVVILGWDNDGVEIIDPDDRNAKRQYHSDYVRQYLNPIGGGCTIVLPRV